MSVRSIEAEVYIQSGVEAEVEIGREIVKTVYEEPVLESLDVVANGTYEPEEGVDGYSDVTVNVPGKIPVLEQLRAIANGEYYPAEGVDGFGEVLVDVPTKVKMRSGKYVPEEDYIEVGNQQIVTVEQIGFVPTRFTLVVSDISTLNQYVKSIIRTSFVVFDGGDNTQYVKITTRYGINGTVENTSRLQILTEAYAGFLRLNNGVITYRTAPNNYILLGGVEYTWYAWAEDNEPIDQNIVEGEFIGTEEGELRVNIPYEGDTFPKMIIVYVEGECLSITGDFIVNANLYAINVCQLLKMYSIVPSYNENSNSNFARLVTSYKGSNSGYSQSALSGYAYSQGSCKYNGDCLKFRDNKTMDVFIQTERDPVTGGIFFMKGIRYKYQVFY